MIGVGSGQPRLTRKWTRLARGRRPSFVTVELKARLRKVRFGEIRQRSKTLVRHRVDCFHVLHGELSQLREICVRDVAIWSQICEVAELAETICSDRRVRKDPEGFQGNRADPSACLTLSSTRLVRLRKPASVMVSWEERSRSSRRVHRRRLISVTRWFAPSTRRSSCSARLAIPLSGMDSAPTILRKTSRERA